MSALKIILLTLALIPLTGHAGLFDDLGTTLRGDAKNETPKQDAAPAADRSSRNLAIASTGNAGKRIALVIGNGNYQHTDSLPKLANPGHDAEDIAKALRGFGFEVIEKKDQSLEGMNDAIDEFSRKLGDSEAALFYYAGHGLQVKGQNYLVPVNAKIETEARVQYEGINVNRILDEMDNGKNRANIVMLDACRNNPISGKFRSGATRGLAAPTSQPKGTVIVYATDPGNVAADGDGRNGLFTAGLLAAFKGGDLSLGGVLTRASEEVERGSDKKQTPYVNGPMTLQKDFHFGQGTQIASLEPVPTPGYVPPAARTKSAEEIEDDSWSAAEAANTEEAIDAYLSGYPGGRFVTRARIKLATLKPAPIKPVEPIPAPVKPTPIREDAETALWSEVLKGGAAEDYRAYLAKYPKGKYDALAKARLKKLDDEAAQQARQEREAAAQQAAQQEQSAWDSANSNASEAGYQDYLSSYPKGRFETLAQARLAKLKKEASQQAAQQAAQARAEAARPAPQASTGSGPAMIRIPGRNYEMGKYEVTQKEWREVMGSNPSQFSNCGDTCPVEQVSWDDIQTFLQKLSQKTGKQYRLPTEAEWEYACYGGSQTEYCGGSNLDAVGWYKENRNGQTHPAGQKQTNGYGLYDMSGNVWEWVQDCYDSSCDGHAIRGGSWVNVPSFTRSTSRYGYSPAIRYDFIGFRVARTLP